MSADTTRRGLLVGSLLLPTISSVSSSGSNLVVLAESEYLIQLRQRRDDLLSEIRKLDGQWTVANQLLPLWCKPGPKFQDEFGRLFGPRVGWPAAIIHPIQLTQTEWMVRPSPRDLRQLFEDQVVGLGRETAASYYRIRYAQLRNRLRLRRELHRSVRLPRSREWESLDLGLEEVESAISSLLTGEQLVLHSGHRSSQVAD